MTLNSLLSTEEVNSWILEEVILAATSVILFQSASFDENCIPPKEKALRLAIFTSYYTVLAALFGYLSQATCQK